jgi:peptidoglycan/xylan/chitin deacetylase (PgdA/CDA1 family)
MRRSVMTIALFGMLFACKKSVTPETAQEQALGFENSLTSGTQIGLKPMEVALTLDDGPVPESLPLAQKLRDLEVPVTYFMIGVNIQSFPEVTRKIAELKFTSGPMAGQPATILANHSWDHKRKNSDVSCIACDGTEYANMEIKRTDDLIAKYVNSNRQPFFFRAPGGNFFRRDVPEEVQSLNEVNKSLGKYIGPFFWDVSGDVEGVCLTSTAKQCGDFYMSQIRSKGRAHGIIILAHDIHQKTRTMLLGDGNYPGIIAQMKDEGFRFVHLDKYPAALSKFGTVPANEFGEVRLSAKKTNDNTFSISVDVRGAARIEVFVDKLSRPLFSGSGASITRQQVFSTLGQRVFTVKGFDKNDRQIAQGNRAVMLR